MTEVKVRHTLLNRGLEGQGYYKQYKSFRNQYSTLVDRVRTCQKQIHHEMFPTPRYIKECSTLPDSHHRRRGNLARVADVYAFCTEAFCLQDVTVRHDTERRAGVPVQGQGWAAFRGQSDSRCRPAEVIALSCMYTQRGCVILPHSARVLSTCLVFFPFPEMTFPY